MFRAMLHRTIGYTFNHKKTRDIIINSFSDALKDPHTRKLFENMLEECLLEYCRKTGYHI